MTTRSPVLTSELICFVNLLAMTLFRNYLYLFLSQDARERLIVRLVAHQLYGRLPKRRSLFRRVLEKC